MRRGYWIALPLTGIGATFAALSWFMAQDGLAYFWVFEILGFTMVIIFGLLGLTVVSMQYWTMDQRKTSDDRPERED